MDKVKVTIEHVNGTDRQVADAARTTINLDSSEKVVKPSYMRKLYLSEHSPIRIKEFNIVIENIPYWVAMHFVRHHVGMTPFVSTQRNDRQVEYDREAARQDEPVKLRMVANAQAIINMSRKRLCQQAATETREIWREVLGEINRIDPMLAACCVPECIYRGHCFEYQSCGFHTKHAFNVALYIYRKDINQEGLI